mgnify:CR=1 FL=1
MKKEELFETLGDLDPAMVKKARDYQRSQAKRNWMTTLQNWRKQKREITARSARKWICSC